MQAWAILTKGLYSPSSGSGVIVTTEGQENPLPDLHEFIYGRLAGDTAITDVVGTRIYNDELPQAETDSGDDSALYPCILFTVVSAPTAVANGGEEGITSALVQIVAVNRSKSLLSLREVGNRIAALFGGRYRGQQGALYIAGGHIERSISGRGSIGGILYSRVGGDYRILCHHYPAD